jgi:urease accessory protein UreF
MPKGTKPRILSRKEENELRELLRDCGISLSRVAEAAGVSHPWVVDQFRGARRLQPATLLASQKLLRELRAKVEKAAARVDELAEKLPEDDG